MDILEKMRELAIDKDLHLVDPLIHIGKIIEESKKIENAIKDENGIQQMNCIGNISMALTCLSLSLVYDLEACANYACTQITKEMNNG